MSNLSTVDHDNLVYIIGEFLEDATDFAPDTERVSEIISENVDIMVEQLKAEKEK